MKAAPKRPPEPKFKVIRRERIEPVNLQATPATLSDQFINTPFFSLYPDQEKKPIRALYMNHPDKDVRDNSREFISLARCRDQINKQPPKWKGHAYTILIGRYDATPGKPWEFYAIANNRSRSVFIAGDLDVSKATDDMTPEQRREKNTHLFDDLNAQRKVKKALAALVPLSWDSNSKNGFGFLIYTPSIVNISRSQDVANNHLHKRAADLIYTWLEKEVFKETGINIHLDRAQGNFRHFRGLAHQYGARIEINREPIKFTFDLESVPETLQNNVPAYRAKEPRTNKGSAHHKFNIDNPLFEIVKQYGFSAAAEPTPGAREIVLTHDKGETGREAVIYTDPDGPDHIVIYSESTRNALSLPAGKLSASDFVKAVKYDNDNGAFNAYLSASGYENTQPTPDQVKEAGNAIKKALADLGENEADQAGKIIFSYCSELKYLPIREKRKFINDYCSRDHWQPYFKAYLRFTDYKLRFDKTVKIGPTDYMDAATVAINKAIQDNDRLLITSETGSGKTSFIMETWEPRQSADKRIILAVPLKAINGQLKRKYKDRAIFLTGDSSQQDILNARDGFFIVGTYEQAARQIKAAKEAGQPFDYIVIDEIHNLLTAQGYKAGVIADLTRNFTGSKIIGLTGTPAQVFKSLGFYMLKIERKRQQSTPINVIHTNAPPVITIISHLNFKAGSGRVLIRYNNIKDIEHIRNDRLKMLKDPGEYTARNTATLYSSDDKKESDLYKDLVLFERLQDKYKLIMTTAVIDEGINIRQQGFTDVIFIGDWNTTAQEIKQFFARFRDQDPRRKYYLILPTRNDQTPTQISALYSYKMDLEALESYFKDIPAAERRTSVNGFYTNNRFLYPDGEINKYSIAYQAEQKQFTAMNDRQKREYLETNYNIKYKSVEYIQSVPDAIGKENRDRIKRAIADAWHNHKAAALQALALTTQSRTIRAEITIQQITIPDDVRQLVETYPTDFQNLYTTAQRLQQLAHPDPDSVLIDQSDGAPKLTSTQKINTAKEILRIQALFNPEPGTSDKRTAVLLAEFAKWAENKREFTSMEAGRKLKAFKRISGSIWRSENVGNLLTGLGIEFVQKRFKKERVFVIK